MNTRYPNDSELSADSSAVLFEFIRVGRQVRVAAIDEQSGMEVRILALATVSRQEMERVARMKLRSKMKSSTR